MYSHNRPYSWRAAEHLCQYIIDHPQIFRGKVCCELGAGLGLVSILLDKMDECASLLVTDGDEDTMNLLIDNKIGKPQEKFFCVCIHIYEYV